MNYNPYSKKTFRFRLVWLALAFFALLCVWFSGCKFSFLGPETEADKAKALYEEAWQLVANDYVDDSYNGQHWEKWRHLYEGKLQTLDDAYVGIETMLASLNDPYSRFLKPQKADEQNLDIDSKLSGVGIQIAPKDNIIVVITPVEDSPAEKAGVKPLDKVLAVNGHSTLNMDIDSVVKRIRGPKGTNVTLTMARGKRQFNLTLTRQEIVIKRVFGQPVNKDIGYIRLSSFISEDLPEEIEAKLAAQKNTKAMILDLRGNSGGLFPNALTVVQLFMDKGKIVGVSNRNQPKRWFEANNHAAYKGPLVVLIDPGTASASEIVSGALKDNHRAVLIGETTFGKGLVQKINPLQDGSELNLTVSKYYTPAGTDINKKGIPPNIEVPFTLTDFKALRDPQKEAAVWYLKKQLARG